MSLERINLYNPVQESLNVLRDMRRYHQEMQDADIVASFNMQFADSLEIMKSESVQPVQTVHKLSRKSRRAIRIDRNKRKKGSDRAHGKKRPASRKDRVRAEDDRAQQERPVGMWRENCKGDYVFRPFQRSNRHNTHLFPEQEHLNLLKVGAKRMTPEAINWAKAIVQNAAEEGQEWAIYDALAEQLDYCPTPEKEVALLTVILLSWWTEQFDGYVSCGLPATKDCFDSIGHNNWYK